MRQVSPRRAARAALPFELLESRQLLSATLQVGPSGTYQTIHAAVAAAHPGDNILVSPGTYVEQVVIPAGLNNLTIRAKGAPGSVILQAPTTLTGSNAIVYDSGANGLTVTGFTIQGPATGISAGVLVSGANNVQISGDVITHIHDAPLSGNQSGFGIQVTNGGSAQISDDTISDYQKNGIDVRGAGSSAAIFHVTVTGDGPTAVSTQNGIVFLNGASGSVTNSSVSANQTLQSAEAVGILSYNSGQVSLVHNQVFNNDGDIRFDGSLAPLTAPASSAAGSVVAGNETYGATFDGIALLNGTKGVSVTLNDSHDNGYDGLLIDSTSTGNYVTLNVLVHNNRSNVGAFDLEDDTFGQSNTIMGNGGTANFYFGNFFGTTNTSLQSRGH